MTTIHRWVEIGYKCACMKVEAEVHVKERREGETADDFMERAREAIYHDHETRSPLCENDTMEYARIPVEDDMIGRASGGTA